MVSPTDYLNLRVLSCDHGEIDIPEDVSPRTYFDFALADLSDHGSIRSTVNSLSNAKRALHYQVELISRAYGFEVSTRRNTFYDRLGFCRNCGIVGPRILSKLNRVRNAVEHEYYVPSRSEAEDFLDVVELFLAATDRYIKSFPHNLGLEVDSKPANVPNIRELDISAGVVYLFVHPGHTDGLTGDNIDKWKHSHSIKIRASDPAYFEWVNFALNNCD